MKSCLPCQKLKDQGSGPRIQCGPCERQKKKECFDETETDCTEIEFSETSTDCRRDCKKDHKKDNCERDRKRDHCKKDKCERSSSDSCEERCKKIELSSCSRTETETECESESECSRTCDRPLDCGCALLYWSSKKGCKKFATKLVSLASTESLERSLTDLLNKLTIIYNNSVSTAVPITAAQIEALDILSHNSTLQDGSDTSFPPLLYVGVTNVATDLAGFLNDQIALAFTGFSATFVFRLIDNDLADVTFSFTFSTGILPPATTTYVLLAQMHVVDCGLAFPVLDWGILGFAGPPRLVTASRGVNKRTLDNNTTTTTTTLTK